MNLQTERNESYSIRMKCSYYGDEYTKIANFFWANCDVSKNSSASVYQKI